MTQQSDEKLILNDQVLDLKHIKSTLGPSGIDVGDLKSHGKVIFDPGFMNTAQTRSQITYINGKDGKLSYRGYSIEDLIPNAFFLDVAYLLIWGKLPDVQEYQDFESAVLSNTRIDRHLSALISQFPVESKPIASLATAMNLLENFNPQLNTLTNEKDFYQAVALILGKTRSICAYLMRMHRDQDFINGNIKNGFVDDFLRMCFADAYKNYQNNQVLIDALDKTLILQIDHEQNCSTSIVRIVGSTDASLFSSIAAGINALSGPKHGGANKDAFDQLFKIQQFHHEGKSTNDYINSIIAQKKKVAGFGHRVYKTYDPRAKIAKKYALRLHKHGYGDRELFEIALELENLSQKKEYFQKRQLYPNIDFWTALVYHALGFDPEMFTPIFALARIPGWIAHWKEMREDKKTKIGRPAQIYVGKTDQVLKQPLHSKEKHLKKQELN